MSKANFFIVKSPEHLKELLSADLKRISIINFWAPWAEAAETCHKMNQIVQALAEKYPAALFLQVRNLKEGTYTTSHVIYRKVQVEAEEQSDIAVSFDIQVVPAFIILQVCALMPQKPYCLYFPAKHRVIFSWIVYPVPTLLRFHRPWLDTRHLRLTLHFHRQTNLQQRRLMWFH